MRGSVQGKTCKIVIAEGESGEHIRNAFAQDKGKDNIVTEYLWEHRFEQQQVVTALK